MKEMIGGCCVCSDESGWDENPLVYCDGDGCNVAVHQACYGIVSVPSGPWFCRKCESQERTARVRCELCPSRGGALKRTDTNGWAHVVCALYIPEVRFGDVSTMEPILVSIVPPDRFNKVCCLCEIHGRPSRSGVGACMSCNKPGCRQCFHVTCAQAGGLLCEEQMHSMNNVTYCGYCPHHYAKMKRGHSVKPVPAFRPLSVSSSAGDTADITPDSSPQKIHPPTLLANTASNIAGGMAANEDRRLKRSRSSRASTPVSVKSEPVSQPCALQLTVPPPAAATVNGNGNGTCLPPSTSAPASVARVDGVTRRDSRPSTPITLRAQTESADGYGVLKVKIEKSDLPLFNGGGGHVTGSSPGHTAVTTDDTLTSASEAVKSSSIATAAVAAAPVSASSSSIAALSSCASIVTSQNVVVTTTSTPTDSAIKTTTTTSPASIAPSDTASSGAPVAYTDPAIVGGTHLSDTKLTTSSSLASTTTTTTAVVSVAAGGCDVITDTAAESPAVSGCNSSSAPAAAVVGVVSAAASSGEVPLDGSSITADSSSAAAAAAVSSVGVGVSAEPVKVKRPRAGSGAQQEPRKRKPPGRPRKRASPWQGDEGSEERPVNSNNAQVNGLPSPSLGSYTMLGNRLNTSSAMAQRLGDSLAAEIAEQSAEGLHEPQLPSAGATAATPLVTPPIRPPTQPRTATSLPQTLSELLERQWEQGSQFLMEQAQHFDISALLSCLYQLRRENDQLEEHVSSLTQQRDHLLAVQARLSVSLSDTTPARCPIPPPQSQPPSSSSSSSLSAVAAAAPAPTPPAAVGALGPAVNSAASSRYSRAAPRLLENGETPSTGIHQQQHQQQQHQQQSRMPLTAVRDRSVLLTGRPVSSSSLHSPLSHPHQHHHQMTLSSSAATGSGALPLLVTSSPSAPSPAAVGAANNNNSSLHSSAVGSTALSHLQLHPMAHSQHQPHHHSQHPHQHQHQRLMVAAHEHRLGELRSAGGGAAVSVSAGTDPALAQVRYPSVAHYQMVSPPCSTAPGSGHHVLHLSSAARYRSEKR